LRNSSIDDLSLRLNIGEIENTYQSADFTGNSWQVTFELTPNQTHNITARWYSSDHLLLEETGQFETPSQSATIKPELAFLSAGFDRFDSDCDGASNLDEIVNETDLAIAEGSDKTACSDDPAPLVFSDTQAPIVARQHTRFIDDGISDPIVSYEQQIQIRQHYKNALVGFVTTLIADQDTLPSGENEPITASIRFSKRIDEPKRVQFAMTNVTSAIASAYPGGECGPVVFARHRVCSIPFDWQEKHWYKIKFEKISTTAWRGLIIDTETQNQFIIGTFESQADIRWTQAENRIDYFTALTRLQCQQSQPASTMRYRLGMVNGFRSVSSLKSAPQVCAKAGLGWSEGIRTVGSGAEAQLEYELTLGRKAASR